jgi:hypothetical protein
VHPVETVAVEIAQALVVTWTTPPFVGAMVAAQGMAVSMAWKGTPVCVTPLEHVPWKEAVLTESTDPRVWRIRHPARPLFFAGGLSLCSQFEICRDSPRDLRHLLLPLKNAAVLH